MQSNPCQQKCSSICFFFYFFWNTPSCRPRTVGGFEKEEKNKEKKELNWTFCLVGSNGMLLLTAKRTKSWNNNKPNVYCIFQTNVSVTIKRYWWHIMVCNTMSIANLNATHVHNMPHDSILTHSAGEKSLKHSPCLSVWRAYGTANSWTRKTLSEISIEFSLNIEHVCVRREERESFCWLKREWVLVYSSHVSLFTAMLLACHLCVV